MKNQSTPTVVLTSLVVIHQFETLKSPANPLAKQKCYFLYVFQVIPLLILKFLCWMGSANDYFCGLDSKGKVNNRFHFSRIPRIQASRPPNHQWNISRLITLQGINISYLGKRKIIFKSCFLWDMLVPRRVTEVWVPKKKKTQVDTRPPNPSTLATVIRHVIRLSVRWARRARRLGAWLSHWGATGHPSEGGEKGEGLKGCFNTPLEHSPSNLYQQAMKGKTYMVD